MSDAELIPDIIILGERNYEAALDMIFAEATNDLLIFDQDFLKGDYAGLKRYELIRNFLSNDPLSKFTIILQDTQYFINHCPKLVELLKLYGHKMTVYETNNMAKIAKDCFVIADKRHYLRRFHIDQARFKFAFNNEEMVTGLLMRFDELLAETANTVSVTKLGL